MSLEQTNKNEKFIILHTLNSVIETPFFLHASSYKSNKEIPYLVFLFLFLKNKKLCNTSIEIETEVQNQQEAFLRGPC